MIVVRRCSRPDRGGDARSTSRSTRTGERWYNRAIELNIQNLAAVPSIVYGILGLAFLVRGPIGLGRVLLAGALTLSLLVLPIVIIAAREAIRAVPPSIREGALALGRDALADDLAPGAARSGARDRNRLDPGAVARDRRDGAADPDRARSCSSPFNPTGLDSDQFTALPIQIFNWTSRPQDEFKLLAAAAILVLLVLLLTMNAFAIWLRNRYQRRW